jgi:hypothetical protein
MGPKSFARPSNLLVDPSDICPQQYFSIFIEEGGWTRYKLISRVNPVNLDNNRSKKLRTLIGSARVDHLHP